MENRTQDRQKAIVRGIRIPVPTSTTATVATTTATGPTSLPSTTTNRPTAWRDRQADRAPRFDNLQEAAIRLLPAKGWPGLRTCRRMPITPRTRIEVRRGKWGAYRTGLRRAWVCPHCAQSKAAQDAATLRAAAAKWELQGGQLLLVTLTLAHQSNMPLQDLLYTLEKAYTSYFSNGRRCKRRCAQGVVASAKALEMTYSKLGGWHPHIHLLLFLSNAADRIQLEATVMSAWRECVALVGVEGVFANEKGFDAKQIAANQAGYLRKGVGPAKHEGSNSVWDLLEAFCDHGDVEAGERYLEYVRCTKGKMYQG